MKRGFGALLTILGIAGLIYTGVLFYNTGWGTHLMKAVGIYGILGLLFFISGIGLIRSTRDAS